LIKEVKYQKRLRKLSKLTCIIGGKCNDGVVLASDSKVTYDDHPPSVQEKLHSPFYHIITGGAGSTDLYGSFRNQSVYATQPDVRISPDFTLERQQEYNLNQPVQTSGIILMYGGQYNYSTIQTNFGNLVKGINRSKYALDINGSLELLVATQIADKQTAELTHFTAKGPSDVHDYRGIGSSGMYTYIFLKPFFANAKDISMYKFARIAYFIIRYIERFEIDTDVGGEPQMWFVPNTGELYTLKTKEYWRVEFENHSAKTMTNFDKNILHEFL
jgi:20S proteasome alpha/beta subunit